MVNVRVNMLIGGALILACIVIVQFALSFLVKREAAKRMKRRKAEKLIGNINHYYSYAYVIWFVGLAFAMIWTGWTARVQEIKAGVLDVAEGAMQYTTGENSPEAAKERLRVEAIELIDKGQDRLDKFRKQLLEKKGQENGEE